ncbi:hypothetical protein MLD38_005259 [Melastoma candidum]|uniref:Uncharacterized protein n=1 Tax=Melastoma candidum TaxID=119954 RepID=A0ACB9SD55_9MYRT|nr:hypothetical protein MLD38_005259 [Melastoma candidum]
MADTENGLPPSKKRAAGRELNRDRPELDEEEDAPELEGGTFKRASDDVLATRRIVKVRRNQGTSVPASNPFAGIRLVQPEAPNPSEANSEQLVCGNQKPMMDALREKNVGAVEVSEKEKVNEMEPLSAPSTEETGVIHNANTNDPNKAAVEETGNNVEKDGVVNNTDSHKDPTTTMAKNDARAGVGMSEHKMKVKATLIKPL